jgi:hypothetical protein
MKLLISLLVAILLLASCKERSITDSVPCELTMPLVAGNYKITKLEKVYYATGIAEDVTTSLTNCDLTAVYNLKIDSTASYSVAAACTGNATGTWNISSANFHCSFTSSEANRISNTSTASWDCSKLVLITMFPSVVFNLRYTLTRQ